MTKQKTITPIDVKVEDIKGFIYKITNKLNSKAYVGITDNTDRRFHEWSRDKVSDLGKDIQKEGLENFTFEILAEGEPALMRTLEGIAMIQHGTLVPNGYNKSTTPDKVLGTEKDIARREKIRAKNTGRKMTAECIQRREAAKKARKQPHVRKDENFPEWLVPNKTE